MTIQDLEGESFVLHRHCSTTEQKILRLFEEHGTHCRIAAEVWSFENIKSLVEAQSRAGDRAAGSRCGRSWRPAPWCEIALPELNIPRQTFMIYREHGQHSDAARELIEVVRGFNWESTATAQVRPLKRRA